MKKVSKVVFIDDKLEDCFYKLDDNDPVKKSIIKAIKELKKNAFSGTQIPKRLIPDKYVKYYGINNLWKKNLVSGWRLLYTVTADNEVELITALLEWFDHKRYEHRMNY